MHGNGLSLSVGNFEALSLIYRDGCFIRMNDKLVRDGTRRPMNDQLLWSGLGPEFVPSKTGK